MEMPRSFCGGVESLGCLPVPAPLAAEVRENWLATIGEKAFGSRELLVNRAVRVIRPAVNKQSIADAIEPSCIDQRGKQLVRVLVPADKLGDLVRREPRKITVGSVLAGEVPQPLQNAPGDGSAVTSTEAPCQGLHFRVGDCFAFHLGDIGCGRLSAVPAWRVPRDLPSELAVPLLHGR